MYLRRTALLIVSVLGAFAAVTWLALEGHDVAILRTRAAAGTMRETRVWIAEQDGALWVEAATPERAFYRDLQFAPEVEIVRGDDILRARATAQPGPEGHARIRSLLRAKYGWADRWVSVLQDTSRSIAVRLEPSAAEGKAP